MSREVIKKFINVETLEGAGVLVRRSIGSRSMNRFDPFLLLDEFKGDENSKGFPDHPHRGFETVTYMIEGRMIHEDFNGHVGIIESGDLQWMTAGRGIMHSEMPAGKVQHGLQLWVNLKKTEKMIEPIYQELKSTEIPNVSENGVHVKVIAGTCMGKSSPVRTRTPTLFLDFKLDKGAKFTQPVPVGWNAFAFVIAGVGQFGTKKEEAPAHFTVLLSDGESITFSNNSDEQLHLVLVGGEPLDEPIAQRGPFVMNTEAEIAQAFSDFQQGKNGFENARHWKSKSGNR